MEEKRIDLRIDNEENRELIEGGVDIYGDNMSFEGMTAPNVFGGEDYLAVMGDGDEIMSYDDPLMHSNEYRMNPFNVR